MRIPTFFGRTELRRALWTFRHEFLIVGAFSMIANLLMLTPTLYMLQVYDRVLHSRNELTLLAVSLITLALFCVLAFAEWMRSRVLVRAGQAMDASLSTRVFNASFESRLAQAGAGPARSLGDLIQLRQFLSGGGTLSFFDTPWVPIYMGVLFLLHPMLGVLSIVFALLQGALAWLGHRRTVAPAEAVQQATSESGGFLFSKLRNVETLEAMGMVDNLRPRWAQLQAELRRLQGVAQSMTHRVTAISKTLRYSQQSLVLGAGALLVIDGQLSVGAMIAANVLMTRALAPIDTMVSSWRSFLNARAAFHRLEALLEAHPERDPALTRMAPQGVLELRNVVASAPGRSTPILKGVSTSAQPGTVTVVLGPSGSGKSTLARCMIGIWPGVTGEVLLDGRPIQGWDRDELGPHLGYLPQDIELFEGSIAENIARSGQVDSQRVIEAATSAGLHEMILRFPKGYDTQIGEAGGLLSGGQRQRIGLARAIYGNPVLVVLDEPNANLDDAGEAALVRAVEQLKAKGCTVYLISHRPGILAVADRVLILRDGQVVQEGPRDAVLQAMRAAQAGATGAAASGGSSPRGQLSAGTA